MSSIYEKLEDGNAEANSLADKKYEEMMRVVGL
jgi:hypothetical protein